jgi:hypothetical protein
MEPKQQKKTKTKNTNSYTIHRNMKQNKKTKKKRSERLLALATNIANTRSESSKHFAAGRA